MSLQLDNSGALQLKYCFLQSIEDITRIVREAQQSLNNAAWGDDDYIDDAMENEDLENEAYGSSLDDWGLTPGGSS